MLVNASRKLYELNCARSNNFQRLFIFLLLFIVSAETKQKRSGDGNLGIKTGIVVVVRSVSSKSRFVSGASRLQNV